MISLLGIIDEMPTKHRQNYNKNDKRTTHLLDTFLTIYHHVIYGIDKKLKNVIFE